MASTMYTESLSQLIKHMGSGNFIRAKYIRRGIDRQKEAVNWLQLDQEYMQRFNALKKAVEASDKRDTQMLKFTGEEFGAFSGKSMKMSTARKFIHTVEDTEGKGAGDRLTYRELSETVIPKFYSELKDVKEMGHKDISILRATLAMIMDDPEMHKPKNAKKRQAMRAMYVTLQELDKVTDPKMIQDPRNPEVGSLERLLSGQVVQDVLNSDYSIKATAKIAVEAFRGIDGRVTFELENETINQLKGHVARKMGDVLKGVVESNPKEFEKLYKDVDISGLKGSKNILERVGDQVKHLVDPKMGGRPKASVLKPKPASGGIRKGKPTKKQSKSSKVRPIVVRKKQKRGQTPQRNFTITALLGILNQKLPDTVAKNMGAPRLENVTGRFAQSVRAIDVNVTPQGFPSVGYRYQSDPYSVFEKTSGTRFADAGRDPRTLIDASIREIAAQTAVGRIFTRRIP